MQLKLLCKIFLNIFFILVSEMKNHSTQYELIIAKVML